MSDWEYDTLCNIIKNDYDSIVKNLDIVFKKLISLTMLQAGCGYHINIKKLPDFIQRNIFGVMSILDQNRGK